MSKTLVVIPGNCTGCKICETVCAMAKSIDGALGDPRIRVFDIREDRHLQMTCLQCVNAACVQACPTGALARDGETRAIDLTVKRCIGCGSCEVACPFGHIAFSRYLGVPQKCDLCGGDPVCAKFCPEKALVLRD